MEKSEIRLCRRRTKPSLVTCKKRERLLVVSKMEATTSLETLSPSRLLKWARAKRVMARRWRRKSTKVERKSLEIFSHFSWMKASNSGCCNNFFLSLLRTYSKW